MSVSPAFIQLFYRDCRPAYLPESGRRWTDGCRARIRGRCRLSGENIILRMDAGGWRHRCCP